jgi:hypothetical protein
MLIPRTFHFLWFGDAPLPAEHAGFRDGWAANNPGWEIRTWDEASLPPLRNRAAYDAATTWAGKADIARLEILLAHGGVYADCDFESLRPIEPLLDGVGFFAARDWGGWIPNTLMGCAPGHPVVRAMVDAIPARLAAHPDAPPNVQSGPHLVTEIVTAHQEHDPTIRVFPKETFYPYSYEDRHLHGVGEDHPGAVAVHHWAASWIRRRLVVAVDWDRPYECAGVIGHFCERFGPQDPVELVVATPGEPVEADGARVSGLLTELVAPGTALPEIWVSSFAELGDENFDAAVIPTGDPLQAAQECAAAVAWMTTVRHELDGGAPRLRAPRLEDCAGLRARLVQSSAARRRPRAA